MMVATGHTSITPMSPLSEGAVCVATGVVHRDISFSNNSRFHYDLKVADPSCFCTTGIVRVLRDRDNIGDPCLILDGVIFPQIATQVTYVLPSTSRMLVRFWRYKEIHHQ